MDLARLVARHGTDAVEEVVALLRDRRLAEDAAGLLELLATAQPTRVPRRGTGRPSKRSLAFLASYDTWPLLEPLIAEVGLDRAGFDSIESAQAAVLEKLRTHPEVRQRVREDNQERKRPRVSQSGGELAQLADVIVAKRRR